MTFDMNMSVLRASPVSTPPLQSTTSPDPVSDSLYAVLDAHPDCVMLIELDGKVSYISRKGRCPRTLSAFDQLVGQTWASLYPDNVKQRLSKAFEEASEGSETSIEADIVAEDGTERRWLFQLSPVLAQDNPDSVSRVLVLSRPMAEVRPSNLARHEADHRIKNSLAAVSSLLRLQARANKETFAGEALEAASERVLSVSRVHDHLQPPKKSNLDGFVSSRDFLAPLLVDLIKSVSGEKITVLHEIEDIELTADQATALGLIVTELTINAARHAFRDCPDGGLIHFSLHTLNTGTIRMIVSDSGCGFPPDFDWRAGSGIGGRVIDLYSRSLGGTIRTLKAPLGGARVELDF